MKIGYIVHDLNDPSVERRCLMLEEGGAKVILAGFYRGDDINKAISRRLPLNLGQTFDSAMAARAINTSKTVFFNKSIKSHFKDCSLIIARNLEQLAIANTLTKKRPLIYECLDLHRLLLEDTLPAKIIQTLERKLLPNVDLLLTSSPGFIKSHFDGSTLDAPTYLIENKLSVSKAPLKIQTPAKYSSVLKIGWFGMLRCQKTFTLLKSIVTQSKGRIEVIIAGKPSPAELPSLPTEANALKGMSFSGSYTYSDLPKLYGECHLAWAIDWFEEGLNSDLLLPNRLYESIAHGTVPIVLKETEMGAWTKERNVGLRISKKQSIKDSILTLQAESLQMLQEGLKGVLPSNVYADKSDSYRLVKTLSTVAKS